VILLLSINYVTAKRKFDFNSKYLIYSSDIKTDSTFWANFFIFQGVNFRVEAAVPFGDRYKVERPNQISSIPIQVNKIEIVSKPDGIFYTYDFDGEKICIMRYSKTPNDTCRFKRNISNLTFVNASVFTGKDTTIVFSNYRLRCWKFIEWRDFLGYTIVYEKFLDKRSYIPILIREHKLVPQGNQIVLQQSKCIVLRLVLDSSEVKSREWRLYSDPLDDWYERQKNQR
jgi:hypothetical protein